MNHSRLLQILTLVLMALPLCRAEAQTAAPAAPELEWVGAQGSQLFVKSGATGMVLVLVRGNQVMFRGYGETAPGSQQPPTMKSVVRLCSLTKIFTTDVLTKLVEDGTVKLDDPLQKYAPLHTLVPRRNGAITLLDLATHTAGLPREVEGAPRGMPHFTYPDHDTRWRWLSKQRLKSTPGAAALYSNAGFDLLSDALEKAAHEQYAALLDERTLRPLGMRDTTLFPNEAQCARLLRGAHDAGPCTSTEETAGSSGLYSTPAEMATWLKYLLGTSGRGIPTQNPKAEAVYVNPSALLHSVGLDHAGTPSGVGLGWIHLQPEDSVSRIVEKTGGGAGFTTYIAINRARSTALFLAATDGADWLQVNLFKEANNLLLAAVGLPPLPPEPEKHVVHRVRARHATKTKRSR